jgi:hypothetical protein
MTKCWIFQDVFTSSTKLDTSIPVPPPPPSNSPSWEADSASDSQEICHILRNLKVHYHVNNSHLLVCMPTQINRVHARPSCFFKAHFNIILWSKSMSYKLSPPSCLPTKTLYVFVLPHTCHMPHPSQLVDLSTQTTSGEQHKSWSSSLCNLLQSPVTSYCLGPNILLSALLLNTHSLCSSLMWETEFHRHRKKHTNYSSIYFKSLYFHTADKKTKDSGQKGSRHTLNLICP